jgi:HAAS domain-containing protein
MTTLVDRYLSAVKEQLPRAQQDDVIAELSENLRAQIEDEEATLGRPLVEDEEAAILKRFGNPMVVAARYRGDSRSVNFGRQLIGPELFPTYLKVLTVNVAITLIVIVAVLLVGGGTAWSSMYGGLAPIAIQFVIVTGIFIYADRRFSRDPDAWDPHTVEPGDPITGYGNLDGISDKLIGEAKTTAVPYTTSLLDFGLNAFGLAVLRSIGVPQTTGSFAPGPAWTDLYVPFTALFALALIGPIVNLIRPRWVEFRVATRALFDGAFAVLGVVSLAIGQWVVIAPNVKATQELVDLVDAINLGVRIGVAATIVFTAMSFVLELRRLLQLRRARAAD